MRRSATSHLNACCVVCQRSPRRWWCPLLSQNWAALQHCKCIDYIYINCVSAEQLFNSEAKASVPGTSNKLGEWVSDWVSYWLIEYAIFLCGLAQQWRPRQKRNLAQREPWSEDDARTCSAVQCQGWKWTAYTTARFCWRSRCCQSCVALPVTRTCFTRTAHRHTVLARQFSCCSRKHHNISPRSVAS